MSFSGGIRLDPIRIATSGDAIEARAADMASRRAVVEETVEALLATWRGAAALRFGELWSEWRDHADAVIDGLGGSVESLRGARDLLCSTDSGAGASQDRLRGRLG
ncbi:WXG100 family type VII secretion target [Nocardioides sp. B-3]|uniref:WXG100 family type VII secretion target n=1 Tax=Nocardioides sp. B-3 TaxID=2895565 RepID=UPI0021529ABA|nr:WXG100 family type VII secretion target [Nocardioides sp. B-3]UUZ60529.1 WXG100 family type VII secretion target [Nocardioides sp. B-3]